MLHLVGYLYLYDVLFVGLQAILTLLLSMDDAYLTWRFISADFFVVPETFIDLKLSVYDFRWAPRSRISVNFPLVA